jgi:hypothetical protein
LSKLHSGLELPQQFITIVCPKQGIGASSKHGMIVAKALEILALLFKQVMNFIL